MKRYCGGCWHWEQDPNDKWDDGVVYGRCTHEAVMRYPVYTHDQLNNPIFDVLSDSAHCEEWKANEMP